jgi:hypothetical protein
MQAIADMQVTVSLKSEFGKKCAALEAQIVELEQGLRLLKLPVELSVYTDKTYGNDKVRAAEVLRRLESSTEWVDLSEKLNSHQLELNLARVDLQETADSLSILKLQACLELARMGQHEEF